MFTKFLKNLSWGIFGVLLMILGTYMPFAEGNRYFLQMIFPTKAVDAKLGNN